MSHEEWRAVLSLPGLEASSTGRLRVVPYQAPLPRGGTRTYGGVPTAGQWDGTRFLYRFRGKTYKAARLVCEAFHGPPPSTASVCSHQDENSRNNLPGNLAWDTQKGNLSMPRFIAYCKSRTGDANPYRKGLS